MDAVTMKEISVRPVGSFRGLDARCSAASMYHSGARRTQSASYVSL
jgi:hypothetical protein